MRVSKISGVIILFIVSYIVSPIYANPFIQKDRWGNTPLMLAIQENNVAQAQNLINQMSQTDFDAQDQWGNTALMWVLQKYMPSMPSYRPRHRHRHRHRKWEDFGEIPFEMRRRRDYRFDMRYREEEIIAMRRRGDYRFDMPYREENFEEIHINSFPALTVAPTIINKMSQKGLSLQDHWGNTALIWSVQQNAPDVAVALIPKMNLDSLKLKDVHGHTALDQMNGKPSFDKAATMIRTILQIPQPASPTTVPSKPLDAVEKQFGDYLNPFSIPPAQEETKKISTDTKDFSNKNLSGFDFSNHDWSGCNFSGAILDNANFSNSTVTDADFTKASFIGTNFESCNITFAQLSKAQTFVNALFNNDNQFQHADFTRLSLTGCSFENCNLTGAIFDSTQLSGTDFTNANLTLCSFKNAHIDKFTLFESALCDQTNFTQSTIANTHIKQMLSYIGANFSECDFSSQILSGFNFSHCIFTKTKLTDADCRFCNFSYATISAQEFGDVKNLNHATLSYVSLNGLHLKNKSLKNAIIHNSSCQNCDFTGSILDGISITNSDFTQTIFHSVSMNNPLLFNSKFVRADFSNAAEISQADFGSCNMHGAIFDYSNPINSQFNDRTLYDVQLYRAFGPALAATVNQVGQKIQPPNPTLTLASQKGRLFIWPFETTNFNQNIRITSAEWQKIAQGSSHPRMPGVTFYTLNLLDHTNGTASSDGPHALAVKVEETYPESTLSMTTKFGTVSGNEFSRWGQVTFNLTFSDPLPVLNSQSKDFSYKDFSDQWIESTSFNDCNFSYSNLSNSYFKGCDFTNAHLVHVKCNFTNFQTCNFTNAICSYAKMNAFLPGANFTNAVVDHVSFESSIGFTGAQLMQTQKKHPFISLKGLTHFDHCDFSSRDFSHGVMNNLNASYSSFENCNLSYVDFANAVCTNGIFKNANLENASCAKANFVQADLRDANLNKTDFSDADLRQALFSSPEQLKNAITNKNTRLDKVLIIK